MALKRNGYGSCCSAVGCSKRRGTNLLSKVKMFYFPMDPERRAAWTNALMRENWTPTKSSVLCNAHFISGKPSKDRQHPDYVPSQFSFKNKAIEQGQKSVKRYERSFKRKPSQDRQLLDYVPSQFSFKNKAIEQGQKIVKSYERSVRRDSVLETSSTSDASKETDEKMDSSLRLDISSSRRNNKNDAAVQTDFTTKDIEILENKLKSLQEENTHLYSLAYQHSSLLLKLMP